MKYKKEEELKALRKALNYTKKLELDKKWQKNNSKINKNILNHKVA